jgi:hypothetical protein
MCGYYAIGAGHGLINVTLRTLLFSPASANAIHRVKRYRRADGFPPFSTTTAAWIPFNSDEVDLLWPAASAANDESVTNWFKIVDKLAKDPSWNGLTRRRNEDFHRWRPQSISGGVAPRDPWDYGPGFTSLTGYTHSQYKPLDPSTLITEAQEGLEALGRAMGDWMGAWPAALKGVGCPIFQVNE